MKEEIICQDIFDHLKEIIEQILQLTREKSGLKLEIKRDTKIEHLGLDSLEIMDLISAIEMKLHITMDPQKFPIDGTIQDVINQIMKLKITHP